jgi:hypothetical protein
MDAFESDPVTRELAPILHLPGVERLGPLLDQLGELVLVDEGDAERELESENTARSGVWGDHAAVVPVLRGSADDVTGGLLDCLCEDAESWGSRITVEAVPAPAGDLAKRVKRAQDQFRRSGLDPMPVS